MFITAWFVIVKNGNNMNVYQQKMGNGISITIGCFEVCVCIIYV